MEPLFTLLKSLEPSSQVAVGFLAVLGFCAAKLFAGRTPMRVKLIVFFALFGFAGGALLLSGRNAMAQADKLAPPAAPSAAPSSGPVKNIGLLLDSVRLVGVARADGDEGWIYLGKYEGKAGHWTEGPNVGLTDPSRPPRTGEVVVVTRGTDYYDDQPRYSLFTQRWRLGRKAGTFPAGRRLMVASDTVNLGQNVWCRVRLEPPARAS